MVWLWDGSLSMAGGNVTVSHISRCGLHFVVQTNLQDTVGGHQSAPNRKISAIQRLPITKLTKKNIENSTIQVRLRVRKYTLLKLFEVAVF